QRLREIAPALRPSLLPPSPFIFLPPLAEPPGAQKRQGAIEMNLGVVGVTGEHAVEVGERILQAVELVEGDAAVVDGGLLVWSTDKRKIVVGDGFFLPVEHAQDVAAIDQRLGESGPQLERAIEASKRLIEVLELGQGKSAVG